MGDRLDDWHVEDPGGHAAADYADVDWGHGGAFKGGIFLYIICLCSHHKFLNNFQILFPLGF
jgi:hypothetical protein